MHDSPKLTSFIALRANGWSLASIARQIDVPKSTLWEWDNKHQGEIHLLKHLQLEKLQEKFLPSYEEELSTMRSYLDRLEATLQKRIFDFMDSGVLLQTVLQIRGRLGRMREQVPLRNIPLNQPLAPIPFTGCVTREGAERFQGSSQPIRVDPGSSVVEKQNRTNPDETPPGGKNAPLNLNHLQQNPKNARPVLHSRNSNGIHEPI